MAELLAFLRVLNLKSVAEIGYEAVKILSLVTLPNSAFVMIGKSNNEFHPFELEKGSIFW